MSKQLVLYLSPVDVRICGPRHLHSYMFAPIVTSAVLSLSAPTHPGVKGLKLYLQ